jgi:hypothetical protein
LSDPGRSLLPMRSARPTSILLLLALTVTLGGCADKPDPRAWAVSVCTALSPWRTEISTLADRTEQQMTAGTTPAQAKENLMRLFGGAENASEQARAGVAKAGVPDVTDGDKIADGFMASLSAIRDAYARAKTGVGELPTSESKTFYDRVAQVVAQLQQDYDKSSLDTTNLASAELARAFGEVAECR